MVDEYWVDDKAERFYVKIVDRKHLFEDIHIGDVVVVYNCPRHRDVYRIDGDKAGRGIYKTNCIRERNDIKIDKLSEDLFDI